MFTIEPEAWAYATATATITVPGYSRAQIEMDAIEIAAAFLDCSRDEIVLTAPVVFAVTDREGEHPYRPKEWEGTFKLAHVSVEKRNMIMAQDQDDNGD